MFVNSAAENKLGQTSGVGNKLPTLVCLAWALYLLSERR